MAVFFRGMDINERVALTRAMMNSGDRLDWSIPSAGPGRRQAFDRRRRRQRQPDAGADARRVRRLRADDFGARPRPYRRHARQARLDPRLRLAARQRAIPQGRGRSRLRDHRPDRKPRARRQAALCDPRRDGDGRVDPADHRLDPLQETRRGPARPGHGREDRQRRLHVDAARIRASWRKAWSTSLSAPGCRPSRSSPT